MTENDKLKADPDPAEIPKNGVLRHPAAPLNSLSPSFRPIVGERMLRRLDAFLDRPKPAARVALVLLRGSGRLDVYKPHQRPTPGELFWGGSGTLYEVDMGRHETTMDIVLPSCGDATAFHAAVDVQWGVLDAAQVVRDGVLDIREALRPPLQQGLGDITRQFWANAVADAEVAARKSLVGSDVGREYGLWTRVFLRLTMDESFAAIDKGIALETAEQRLRELREKHTKELLGVRVQMYRTLIESGITGQFGLQLAQNPEDAPAVVQALQQVEREDRRNATDFAAKMIESGAIRRYQIEPMVLSALEWLKESSERAIGRHDVKSVSAPTDEPPPIPGPRSGGAGLPPRSSVPSSLPREVDGSVGPPGPGA